MAEYNSLTKEWRSLPDIPVGKHDHACSLVSTNIGLGILVAGGSGNRDMEYNTASAWLMDLGTEKWYPAGNMTYGRSEFQMVVLGERIFVLGSSAFDEGRFNSDPEDVEEYVLPCGTLTECHPSEMGTWTKLNRKISRRAGGAVVPVPSSRFGCTG